MKKFRKVPLTRVLDSVGSGKIHYIRQFKLRKKPKTVKESIFNKVVGIP